MTAILDDYSLFQEINIKPHVYSDVVKTISSLKNNPRCTLLLPLSTR